MADYHNALKFIREKRRQTVQDVADLSGLSKQTIYAYESDGLDAATGRNMKELARALDMPAGVLLQDFIPDTLLILGADGSIVGRENGPIHYGVNQEGAWFRWGGNIQIDTLRFTKPTRIQNTRFEVHSGFEVFYVIDGGVVVLYTNPGDDSLVKKLLLPGDRAYVTGSIQHAIYLPTEEEWAELITLPYEPHATVLRTSDGGLSDAHRP